MAREARGRDSAVMRTTTISSLLNAGSGRPAEAARVLAAATSLSLRLAVHYAFPSPPLRPMAALILPDQSREGYESTRAGYEMLVPPAVPGAVGRS
jgi:hypothetical protein